jgi:F0F1-type ATP synthase gamma subunit
MDRSKITFIKNAAKNIKYYMAQSRRMAGQLQPGQRDVNLETAENLADQIMDAVKEMDRSKISFIRNTTKNIKYYMAQSRRMAGQLQPGQRDVKLETAEHLVDQIMDAAKEIECEPVFEGSTV